VLALGFWGLAVVAGASGWPDGVVGVPDHVARSNGLLLAFNMVPALPLDGGRLPQPSAATKGRRRWKRCDA
jgi:Zn-dependent protease